ncbi:putative transcription factor C2H2 family [Lupinus albus]|uniref:Putative transcription factor C2H2 family n=1 Tax=Lupinus albus TaxID=3870 RepID=A0A6A4QJZ8_LUPAL|nr:putative transcription factor C2H2 family [Lupinus albus]
METHKCKLCSRSFSNGRALGGHMKAHLATLPLPPKPQTFHHPFESASFSYHSYSSEDEEQDVLGSHEKALSNGWSQNPKKSLRYADPEFSFNNNGFVVVVQDKESETGSKKPFRQRSKRKRKSSLNKSLEQEPKKFKCSFMESPPLSSVSDFSPEDVAMCLMMLSRDKWESNNVVEGEGGGVKEEEIKLNKKKRIGGKNECENCGKKFRSSKALGSHRSICCIDEGGGGRRDKIFECPFCFKVFGSGQALGGHKRSHLMLQQSLSSSIANNNKENFIDLNLPAPIEDDDLTIVSDVSDA